MKKILFVSIALILALSMGLVGCGGGGGTTVPTSIKVGLARDLSGPLAVFECGYGGATFRWYADEVNAGGGIYLSDYNVTVPIELDVKPFDVNTWDIGAVTTALITTDKCNFIWGGPGTDCIESQAPVCNAYATVLITLEGGASTLIWDNKIDGWPYVWVTLSFSNWNQIPVLHDMLQAKVGNSTHNATAWVTGIGEQGATHGIEYTEETEIVFGNTSVHDYGLHPYTLSAAQADAIIAAAKADPGYDIYCFYTYPWNVITLEVSILSANWSPPAILMGPGGNANYMPVFFGPNMNGQMSFIIADNYTSTAISDMYAGIAVQCQKEWTWSNVSCANTYNYTSGWDLLDYWGMPCYVAGLQLWKDAVEQAGNLNSVDVRNALASLNTTTVLGAHTWFDVFGGGLGGGILSYDCHPGEIGQWVNGEYRIVGGNEPTANFTYPMTDSWAWLP